MKNLFQFAIIISLFVLSTSVFADTKVKIRQTMSGQTSENTTYIKGKRQRAEQNYGGMQMVNITQCDLKRSLQIMPVNQTYTINSWESAESVPATTTTKTVTGSQPNVKGGLVTTTVNIKDTGERKQMFGYTARHLIITMNTESSPEACQKSKTKMEMDGWYIDATFAIDCDNDQLARNYSNQKASGGCQDRFEIKQVGTGKRGYPVYEKMTMFDESGKETFSTVNEVLELSKATLEDSLFDVPAGYREVKSPAEMYQTASYSSSSSSASNPSNSNNNGSSTNSGMSQNVQNLLKSDSTPTTEIGAKKAGVVRLGLANVKVSAVGEGLSSNDLALAIQNTLTDYLKGTKVELVQLEAKLPSAIAEEAKAKECDYVIYTNVAHKKGGGGLGMFSKVVAPAIGATGIGHTGSTIGNVAGQVATHAIVSAGAVAGNIKSKDEITIDLKLQNGDSVALTKQYKAKAKANGEDIISPLIEQIAQTIVDTVAK